MDALNPVVASRPAMPTADAGKPRCQVKCASAVDRRDRAALLIFADLPALDLARRRLPRGIAPLTRLRRLARVAGPGVDVHWFTTRGLVGWAFLPGAAIHAQAGSDFRSSLEIAVARLAEAGYDRIVVVGGDCPDLSPELVRQALEALATRSAVLGPDHRGGVYLVGVRSEARERLNGVCWRRNTDCRQLRSRFRADDVLFLPVLIDLDRVADAFLLSRFDSIWSACVHRLLGRFADPDESPPPAVASLMRGLRIIWQLPPPVSSCC